MYPTRNPVFPVLNFTQPATGFICELLGILDIPSLPSLSHSNSTILAEILGSLEIFLAERQDVWEFWHRNGAFTLFLSPQ